MIGKGGEREGRREERRGERKAEMGRKRISLLLRDVGFGAATSSV